MQAKYGEESRYFDLSVSTRIQPTACHPSNAAVYASMAALGKTLPPLVPLLAVPRCRPVTCARVSTACLLLARLQDLENTAGSWDMYGQEETSRYNSLQVCCGGVAVGVDRERTC